MARFDATEVDHYGGQGGTGFFGISENGGVAQVRFLYNGVADVVGDSVHEVKIDGKRKWVSCLRTYKEPLDKCPFCREKMFTQAKLFIPVYNLEMDKIQVWERGKTFFGKMTSLCSRYSSADSPLVSHVFEIERHGEPKDPRTTYEIFEVDKDNTTLDDFNQPEIYGKLVLDKSAEEMEYFLKHGNFPGNEEDDEERPRRRPTTISRDEAPTERRRTPMRRDSEAF